VAIFTIAFDPPHAAAITTYIEKVAAYVREPVSTSALVRVGGSTIPSEAGIYAIYERGTLIYVGESGSLKARFGDLFKTMNHSFRRTLGKKLYGSEPGFTPATTKRLFPGDIEKRLTEHMATALTFLAVPIAFGRIEIEERLVAMCPGLLNSRGQRGIRIFSQSLHQGVKTA
jgi:hypothetical protein